MSPRALVLSFFCTSIAAAPSAQDPAGTWEGGLRVSGQYSPFKLRITTAGDRLAARLDIPSRDLLSVPVAVEADGDALSLEMDHPAKGRARFDGIIADGVFTGSFRLEVNGFRREGRFEAVEVVEMDREQLRHFEGAYDIEGFGLLKIFVLSTGTRLSLQAFALRAGSQIPLFPVGPSAFIGGLAEASAHLGLARIAAATGDVDRAFAELEAAVRAGLEPGTLAREEALRVLREDPRFAELVGR